MPSIGTTRGTHSDPEKHDDRSVASNAYRDDTCHWRVGPGNAQHDRAPRIPALSRRQPPLTAASAGTIANLLAASSHQALAQSYDALRGAEGARAGRHYHGAEAGARRLRVRAGGEEGSARRGAPAHWGYLESGVDGNVTRDANHTAYAKLQHPRPAPDRCAQDRHQREDFRGDVGQPHLLLPGQQPRRLQPGGGGRRGACRRQAQAPDDPLDGRQRQHRRREQGARLARLVHAVSDRRLECDADAGAARRERGLPGHRPHGRPAGRPQHRGHVPRASPGHSATASPVTAWLSPTRSAAKPTFAASTSRRSQTSTAPA